MDTTEYLRAWNAHNRILLINKITKKSFKRVDKKRIGQYYNYYANILENIPINKPIELYEQVYINRVVKVKQKHQPYNLVVRSIKIMKDNYICLCGTAIVIGRKISTNNNVDFRLKLNKYGFPSNIEILTIDSDTYMKQVTEAMTSYDTNPASAELSEIYSEIRECESKLSELRKKQHKLKNTLYEHCVKLVDI